MIEPIHIVGAGLAATRLRSETGAADTAEAHLEP